MGEVGPTRPPDKLNIREMAILTVVLIKPAGVLRLQQCVPPEFYPQRPRHPAPSPAWTPAPRLYASGCRRWQSDRKGQNRRRCANLPKHRGERHQHPVLLLAKLLALHPQPDMSIVTWLWNNAASSRILTALTPQIAAAHSAVLAIPSLCPVR